MNHTKGKEKVRRIYMKKNSNTLIILAHPNPDSFNGAILKTIENKLKEKEYQFISKNLYQLNFNPILNMDDFARMQKSTVAQDVALEHADIEWAKNIILIYPIWWAGQPAILKGWIDRVFSRGFAYAPQEDGTVKGLLSDKTVMVFTTSGSSEENMKQSGMYAAMEKIMLEGILGFCGINNMMYKNFFGVLTATDDERAAMLGEVDYLINAI